ncbi:B-cell differentiation antigen CD72-like isoform X2 [Anolis sagrei]|uniref:B-cell differentiation antigen CD72-like isoform X2 n=1 Tax=Anolis sagrei TaxID=38937 RepID=UPI00352198F5
MAQGVTYADLRFVKKPPRKKVPQQGTGAEDGELTYENIQESSRPHQAEETPSTPKEEAGSGRWSWKTLAVLTATLLLLLLLATAIGLGVRYGQVSGQLQQALQAHAAHSSAQEGSLAQKEDWLQQALAELNSTREALRESQEATKNTQEQLHSLEQEKNQAEAELRRANSCQEKGCCPDGWTLFRWKCLWVSQVRKTWLESWKDCGKKSSQLLVAKEPWDLQQIWVSLGRPNPEHSDGYWIGLYKIYERGAWIFIWADGSHYEGTEQPMQSQHQICGKVDRGDLVQMECFYLHGYICERAASPTGPVQAPGP